MRSNASYNVKTREKQPICYDVGSQTYDDVGRQVLTSAKRPPSSPLFKKQREKTRKSAAGNIHHLELEGEDQDKQIPASKNHKKPANCPTQNGEGNLGTHIETTEAPLSKITPVKEVKRRKKRHKRRPLTEAIIIKPSEGDSYSDILREIRQKVNPEDTATTVKTVRNTMAGDLLLQLEPEAKNRAAFKKNIQGILGERAKVINLEPKTALEIRDLDELTTEEEVREAIFKKIGDQTVDLKIFVTGKNRSSLKMAIVHISERAVNEILKSRVIRIGWSQCRVRRRIEVHKCFRCLDYGHVQAKCNGPNRRQQQICFNCGKTDHKRAECRDPPKCYLCSNLKSKCTLEHVPGSGKCLAFKQALEKVKAASSK